MANMVLGTCTFDSNPSAIDGIILQKKRSVAAVDTYEGVAVFSWGLFHAGRRITLEWDYMTTTQYEAIRAIYEADAAVVWDPKIDDSPATTFNVEIMDFEGAYHLFLEDESEHYRRDVRLDLVITSEVS